MRLELEGLEVWGDEWRERCSTPIQGAGAYANSPADAEAEDARTTFDTLMDGLLAKRWQDIGPTTAELQRRRLLEAFAECAPAEAVPASA